MSVIQKSVKDNASLQNELNKLVVLFSKKEDETTWKQFDEAITVLNLWCGDENLWRLSGFRDGMKAIGGGLKQCLLSDRSKLSGNACNLIMKLSQIWRSAGDASDGDNDDSESFQILNDISFDALLKLCARANKIIVVRGQSTLQELAKCFSASIGWLIRFGDPALCKHPNKNVRNAVALCILVIISQYGKLLSAKFESVMSTLISGFIADADGGVRDTAKRCLQEYCSYDLSSCQTIVANLPPQYAKSCQQILNSYSGDASSAPVRKANAPSSQKQKIQPQTRVVNDTLKVQVDAVTITPQQEEICVNAPANSVIGKNEIRMRSRKQRMTCAVLMRLDEFQVAQSITDAPSVVSRSEVQSLAPRDDSEIGRKRNITEDFRDFLEFKNRKIKSAHASDEEKLKTVDDLNAAPAPAPKPILRKFKSMKQQAAKDVMFAPEIASAISINQVNVGELEQSTAVLKEDSIQTFDEKIKVQCELAQSNESDVQAQRNALNKLMEYVTEHRSISDESKQLITQSVLHCLNSSHPKVLHSTLDLLLMILRNQPAILALSYSEIYVSLLNLRVKQSHMHSFIDEIMNDIKNNHLKPNVVVTLLIELCERAQGIADGDSLLLYGCTKLIEHGVHYDSASLYKRVVLFCVELIQKVPDDQMLKNLADHLLNLQKEHQKTFKALFLQMPADVQNFLLQHGVQCQLSSSTATISEDSKSTHTPRNQNLQTLSQSKVVLSSKVEYRRKEYEVDVASPVQNDEDVNNDMIDVTPIPSSSIIIVDVESIVDSTPTQASVLKGHDGIQLFQFWDILDNCICDAVQQSQIRQQKQFTADDTLQRLVECKINAEQAADLIPQLLLKDSTTNLKRDLVEALICFGGHCNDNILICKQYILYLLLDLTLQDIFSVVHRLSADSHCHQLSIFALHEKLFNCSQMNLASEDLCYLMRLLFRQIKSEDSITAVKSRDCLQMLRKLSMSDTELKQMFNQESQSFFQKDDGQQMDVEKLILEQKFHELELHRSGDEM
ncbi:hypothetical protein MIR68_009471 [Amoeboaphelidium protococcarum]|nr:hypothetical protein MIR68_009471 [Amoeboaphelidium protococcarum]